MRQALSHRRYGQLVRRALVAAFASREISYIELRGGTLEVSVGRTSARLDDRQSRRMMCPLVKHAPAFHKLQSNDGWHVTARECKAAARGIRLAVRKGSPYTESLTTFCDVEFGDEASPEIFEDLKRALPASPLRCSA